MSRGRRGLLLAGLALLLGGLAASDMAGREAALDRRVGPLVDVVVARRALEPGTRLRQADLAVRRVPARFAPAGAVAQPAELEGLRLGAAVPSGADVTAAVLRGPEEARPGVPVRPGERVVDVIATGSPQAIQPGGRVDVLVTRDAADGSVGRTVLALEDVEVLSAHAVPAGPGEEGAPRVTAALRVTLRQAVYLAAAQSFARELRLLPRAAGDRRVTRDRLAVTDAL
ncbi:MAG TPA: Flp pilus assembly protein CpaB [Capillimicrobium sp.]|nr:Flp pilus assembly protein CpaB [Capillimicrobium sp.]